MIKNKKGTFKGG